MREAEFREALRSGWGRILLHARAHDVSEFREIILHACLHSYAVDPQTEGTRAPYIQQLINCTAEPDFYRDQILRALHGHGDDWDAVHRFSLTSYFAMDGDSLATSAMYQNFCPGPRMAEAIAVSFVEMDGLAGFLFAAEKVGALMAARPDEVDEGWLLGYASESLGEDVVRSALRDTGGRNEFVEIYRRTAEARESKFRSNNELRRIRSLPYAELKASLLDRRPYELATWAKHAREEDLRLAADGLLEAQNPDGLLAHLRIFRNKPFPHDHGHILNLAHSGETRIAAAAARALANLTHPSIREFAFRSVRDGLRSREESIAILACNYEPGDHQIVLGWFEQEQDRDIRHRLGIDLRNFWEQHPDSTAEVHMLLTHYEKGPCSECRGFVVDRLIELNSLPAPLRAECAYDSNEETRLLVTTGELAAEAT